MMEKSSTLTGNERASRPPLGAGWAAERSGSSALNRIFHVLLESMGVNRIFRHINRSRICLVRYHGVTKDNCSWAEGNPLQVKESAFRRQMCYLKRNFEVVPLDSVVASQPAGAKPRAVVTFDDGYANNFMVAFPILRELRMAATVFLTTAFLDRDWIFWYDRLFFALRDRVPFSEYLEALDRFKSVHPDAVDTEVDSYIRERGLASPELNGEFVTAYRTLRQSEVQEMGRSGLITFGSHTHRHELLTRMGLDEAEQSLRRSWAVLLQIPGKTPFFCYPNGWYRSEHVALVRSLGFRGAVTTRDGLWRAGQCEYEIPRVGVGRETDIFAFAGYVSGATLALRKMLPQRVKHASA